jgi:predicted TIM-barrel fold metal-dependent hydrolase
VSVDRLTVDTYERMPSEVFARQCFCVGSYERLDRCSTDLVPPARVLWSTSHPGPASTWPQTAATLAEGLGAVPDEDRRRVLWDNAAELYGLTAATLPAATTGRA